MRVRIAVEMEVELDDPTPEEAAQDGPVDITPKQLARKVGDGVMKTLEGQGVDFVWEFNVGYQRVKDDHDERGIGE